MSFACREFRQAWRIPRSWGSLHSGVPSDPADAGTLPPCTKVPGCCTALWNRGGPPHLSASCPWFGTLSDCPDRKETALYTTSINWIAIWSIFWINLYNGISYNWIHARVTAPRLWPSWSFCTEANIYDSPIYPKCLSINPTKYRSKCLQHTCLHAVGKYSCRCLRDRTEFTASPGKRRGQ